MMQEKGTRERKEDSHTSDDVSLMLSKNLKVMHPTPTLESKEEGEADRRKKYERSNALAQNWFVFTQNESVSVCYVVEVVFAPRLQTC